MYLQLLPQPLGQGQDHHNHSLTSGAISAIKSTSSSHTAPLSTRAPDKLNRCTSPSADSNGQCATDKFATGLVQNKEWAAKYPELFPSLAFGQQPEILWIGCSDSRCPETAILGLKPGDVFVHRNIANIIHYSDLNAACVIEYAVSHLKVKHIVLCGHTACGGVSAALGNKKLGILDAWLMPLRRLRQQHLGLLQGLEHQEAIVKLSELNILEGVARLKENSVVLNAIEERGLQVHGLIYDVASGLLRELEGGESHEVIKARLTAFKTQD
ncbi:Carbonic anhydrase [Rasamsonia emersonii CBS 393.64]|uniref:Carbonic anhydrase n=1 Tax=Rasamsonia emersonii (strain ATCC 16479 / CBS 393.64 / IMI 116815) TaxID=1408163 RepID=A0A0F4YV47_RASE3|nr:Carbonic anhydrase [Rasamsonia emersonii CBS 393.64]KKA21706.1 Carbonic anhydrase [Rasamsonia emersonii CBS 393.64]